ncbi:MAG: transaldolase [Calditrichaeota bacterium]|nr:transaldolase [Calditrichota bacterium]
MNKLERLREFTAVVADTGDIDSIKKYVPTDATTNPSLLYKAAKMPLYAHLVEDAIEFGKLHSDSTAQQIKLSLDKLAINFGSEILKIIPGRVSTEVDARLSFNIEGTIKRAHELINLYQKVGADPERVLIKIASTWEGIQAAKELEKDGIHCNLTLLFSFEQATSCADAGVTLVSPFVGRILDWYKEYEGVDGYPANEDPGVKSVKQIYNYYKKFGYETQIMGASFRNIDEVLELAGCDLLTISPALLEQLLHEEGPVIRKLDPFVAAKSDLSQIQLDENHFRWDLNENAMATEKLAEGIRNFARDTEKLEKYVWELCERC